MSQRVNYDELAPTYDRDAYRKKLVDPELAAFLESTPSVQGTPLQVLDIGCGTGAQLVANWTTFPHLSYVGLDFSEKMLELARKKSENIQWIWGSAEELPFDNNRFDYISSQYQLHHVVCKDKMLREVERVLKPGGQFVYVNSVPFEMRDWIIYRYFPETLLCDERDYLPTEELLDVVAKVGLEVFRHRTNVRSDRSSIEDFLKGVATRTNCSQLAMLSEEAFKSGFQKLSSDLTGAKGSLEVSISELTLVARKPTLK